MEESTKTIHDMDEKQYEITVSIQCLVYNHEPYLRQCLDGFVMQKTNFKFEAIVHDDASTDGSAVIIREYAEKYPDIIKPIFEVENQYSKRDGSLDRIMHDACRGKYIAICEGDDYWIDPLKLQKQVDIMIQDQSIGVCYTRAMVFYQETSSFAKEIGGEKFLGFKSQLLREPIMTLTTMYKSDLYNRYLSEIEPNKRNWLMGDTPMWLWFSMNSQIFFLEDITSVYRVLINSASHSTDYRKQFEYHKSLLDIRLFFASKYCADDNIIQRDIYNDFHRRNMRAALMTNNICEYYNECKCLSDRTLKDWLRPVYYLCRY